MDLGLNGKLALITGGTHGIGLAIALGLCHEGCSVIVCSRTEKRVAEAVGVLRRVGGAHHGYSFDALSRASVSSLITKIQRNHSAGIDILVNNVGGGGRWGSSNILNTDFDIWDDVYQKNVGVAIQLTKAFLPEMLNKNWGRVIGITSIYGRCSGGLPWFNVAKTSETAFFKNLSGNRDFIRRGVTFNTVAPGNIMIPDTGWHMEKSLNPELFARKVDSEFPLGRLGTPEEVASVVVFLCSKAASLVNGASVLVDGGESVVI